jgi:RecG-like helicase
VKLQKRKLFMKELTKIQLMFKIKRVTAQNSSNLKNLAHSNFVSSHFIENLEFKVTAIFMVVDYL